MGIYIYILVGGFKHFLFSIIYGIILPIDSYVSEGLKPPTSIYIYIYPLVICYIAIEHGHL